MYYTGANIVTKWIYSPSLEHKSSTKVAGVNCEDGPERLLQADESFNLLAFIPHQIYSRGYHIARSVFVEDCPLRSGTPHC